VLTLGCGDCTICSYNVSKQKQSSEDEQLLPCIRATQDNNDSILERWLKQIKLMLGPGKSGVADMAALAQNHWSREDLAVA
jgi:hypothetical protein